MNINIIVNQNKVLRKGLQTKIILVDILTFQIQCATIIDDKY